MRRPCHGVVERRSWGQRRVIKHPAALHTFARVVTARFAQQSRVRSGDGAERDHFARVLDTEWRQFDLPIQRMRNARDRPTRSTRRIPLTSRIPRP